LHAHAFRICSASRLETMLALFPPERSDHAIVHVWAWREGELSSKLTPAIEAVDVDRLRRANRKIHESVGAASSPAGAREGKDAGWSQGWVGSAGIEL
jgi:hypothetical protein